VAAGFACATKADPHGTKAYTGAMMMLFSSISITNVWTNWSTLRVEGKRGKCNYFSVN
jgi:hypothetical protein